MEGADLKAIFDFIDKDKDGFISKEQFLTEVAKAAPDFVRQIQSFDDIQEPISFSDFEQLISQLEVTNSEAQDLDELERFQQQNKDKENWASGYNAKRRSMEVESMISMESEVSFDTFEQKRYADLANAYEKLIEDYKFAQEELQNNKNLSQKLVSLKQEKSQLEIDLENSRIEIEQLKEKEVLQGKRIFALEKQIKEEQLDDTLTQKTQQHQIEIGNLEADTKKLQFSATEKEGLQTQIKQLQSNKRDLEERMQYLEQKNQVLLQQVKDRDAKLLEEQQLSELRLERLQQELLQYRDSQLLTSAPEQNNNSILEEHTKQLESHIHQLQADKEQLQHKIDQLQTEIQHQIDSTSKQSVHNEPPTQKPVESLETSPRLPTQPEDNKADALSNNFKVESYSEIHDEVTFTNNGILQAAQSPPSTKQDALFLNAQNEQVLAQVKELFELVQHQISLEKQILDLQSQLNNRSDTKTQQITIYKLHLLLTELLQRVSRERSGSLAMYGNKNPNLQTQVATLLQSLKQYNNTHSVTSRHASFTKSIEQLPRILYWAVVILVPCITSFFLLNLYSHV